MNMLMLKKRRGLGGVICMCLATAGSSAAPGSLREEDKKIALAKERGDSATTASSWLAFCVGVCTRVFATCVCVCTRQ